MKYNAIDLNLQCLLGFGEDPFAPTKKSEGRGDAFWKKLLAYRDSGSLMGCSIQPLPVAGKKVTAEANAGQGMGLRIMVIC